MYSESGQNHLAVAMVLPNNEEIQPITKAYLSNRPGNFVFFKVSGSGLLIHAFAYSLLVGIFSIISNMTDYSHSCHSIKVIHWGAP